MAENKQVTTNREKMLARLKGKSPDKEFPDDEAIFQQIHEDYDGYEKEAEEMRGREKAFSDLFTSDPRSASFLNGWRKGDDPLVLMMRMFGDDFKAALEDPAKQDEIAAAHKEYAERIAQEKDYEEQYNANMEQTLATIAQLQQEQGLTDDEIDKAMAFLIGVMKDAIIGKFAPESILMALKAINHDADVEQADQEGEVRGRNAKITEGLRKNKKGDGTASLAGKNGGAMPQSGRMPELGVIDNNYGTKDIWERGGEKRRAIKR